MNLSERIPDVLSELTGVLTGIDADEFDRAAGMIAEAPRIFLAGAGRSGLIVRCFAMRLAQAGLSAHVVGDATTPAIEGDDLLFVASGSGRTETMRAIARRAFGEGCHIVVATYSPESPLALEAHAPLVLPVPQDHSKPGGLGGSQVLGTLFDQSLFLTLDALVAAVMERRGVSGEEMQERHANLQ